MTFTFALTVLASATPMGDFFKSPTTIIFSFILMMVCALVIICNKDQRRKMPNGYLWLAGVTFGEAFFLAAVAAKLTVASVVTAIMATCLATAGLFVASLYTASSVNRETLIRNMVKGMIVAFFIDIFMLIFILLAFNPKDSAVVFGVSCVMCLLAGAYIMFALLFIIVPGMEDKDDFILGAMRLYLEIARLFFWLMQLFGDKK